MKFPQELYNRDIKNIRLDQYLFSHLKNISRNQIQKLIINSCIKVDGYSVKPSYKLKGNENIHIQKIEFHQTSEIMEENIPIDIIYEDEDLVIINKQPGLIVHPGTGNKSGTLLNGLVYHFKKLSSLDKTRPGIIHRLDKDTSGVIIVAKNNQTHYLLGEQFANRKIKKTYRAIVWGDIIDKGEIEGYIKRDNNARISFILDKIDGRYSHTKFKKMNYTAPFSYVELFPSTGRTHQLRVHLKNKGHPIIGDNLYGGDNLINGYHQKYRPIIKEVFKNISRFILHAYKIEFIHPLTKKKVLFQAPIPNDFDKIINLLGW